MSPRARSLLATAALIACVAALAARREVLARHPAGVVLQVAAALLMLWAARTRRIVPFLF